MKICGNNSSGMLEKKTNFKVQYKIAKKLQNKQNTGWYFPLPYFYSTGVLISHIFAVYWRLLAFHGSCTHLHYQVKTQKINRTTQSYHNFSHQRTLNSKILHSTARSCTGITWRLTRDTGFVEKSPSAKLAPLRTPPKHQPGFRLPWGFTCPSLSFLHLQQNWLWKLNSQKTLRDVTCSKEQCLTSCQESLDILSSLNFPGSQLRGNPVCREPSRDSQAPTTNSKSFST